jgi:PPOX class probable F420-dependent enzyme
MPIPDHLLAAEFVNLATFRKNGDAIPTPIWAAAIDGKLYAFSEAKAGKMKRLKNSSRARLVACTRSGKALGIWQEASAYIVDDPAEIESAKAALQQKYGWKMKVADFASKAARRYDKRGYLRIEMP